MAGHVATHIRTSKRGEATVHESMPTRAVKVVKHESLSRISTIIIVGGSVGFFADLFEAAGCG